jgi:hypothetical protein
MRLIRSFAPSEIRLRYVLGAPDAFGVAPVATATRAALAATPVAAPLTAAAPCGPVPAAAES